MKKLNLTTFLLLILFCFGATFTGMAQQYDKPTQGRLKFNASVDFDVRFDNREYKSLISTDKTYFSAKLQPIIGAEIRNHSLNIGTTVIMDFGSRPFDREADFLIYYNYDIYQFSAYAGIFPRKFLMASYHSAIISGSSSFYDSSLEGGLVQYRGRLGFVELALDWTSKISDTKREKFVIFSGGEIRTNSRKFAFGYSASMFHYSVSNLQDGVVDNLMANPYAAFKLTRGSVATRDYEALTLKAGWLQGMQRDRKNENKWKTPGGFTAEIKLEKWRLGLHNTIYVGDNMMPFFGLYGTGLYQGDTFYRTSDFYNRLEAFWHPVQTDLVSLKISTVHHYDGKIWNWQQMLTLSLRLNKNTVSLYSRR